MGTDVHHRGVEPYNSTGTGEIYHLSLRKIYDVTESEYNKLADRIILMITIKTIYDTMGPNGLVRALLVFGTLH